MADIDDKAIRPEIKEKLEPFYFEREKEQYKQKYRKIYGPILTAVMIFQLVFMDVILWQLGNGNLNLPTVVVSVFITGIFASVAGFVLVIVKYLFDDKDRIGKSKK
ncbi:MAG: hypothetical protein KAR42_04625 [candidate division Zixibacteria bacterium]|nr:hypothetical protein [candidate division Zixibacteria bacterium]